MRKYCEMISFPLSKKTTKCGTGKSLCAIIGNKLNCVIAGRPETHTHLDFFSSYRVTKCVWYSFSFFFNLWYFENNLFYFSLPDICLKWRRGGKEEERELEGRKRIGGGGGGDICLLTRCWNWRFAAIWLQRDT